MVIAFSFCLFGTPRTLNDRDAVDDLTYTDIIPGGYYDGLIENIQLINKHYPTWSIFVYMGEDVPEWFITQLTTTYKNVVIRKTGVLGHENTVHRFFAIDEPDVETMFVRDVDSRVHWRDRWAIGNFLSQNSSGVHIIRDHSQHTALIAAGMWGVRGKIIPGKVRDLFRDWVPVYAGSGSPLNVTGYGIDQNFLAKVIYPLIRKNTFVTYSHERLFFGERGVEFPFDWTNSMYVGRVEGLPHTENFWLRELDIPPKQTKGIVIVDKYMPVITSNIALQPLSFLKHHGSRF